MGIKKMNRSESVRRVGMWSTIADAVESGWGSVARLVVVLIALGTVGSGAAVATSNSGLVTILRTLLP